MWPHSFSVNVMWDTIKALQRSSSAYAEARCDHKWSLGTRLNSGVNTCELSSSDSSATLVNERPNEASGGGKPWLSARLSRRMKRNILLPRVAKST